MIETLGNKIVVWLFFGVYLYGGSLEVTLSNREIVSGESVFLTIATVEEQNRSRLPSIDKIGDVKIDEITHTSKVDYVLINGKNTPFYIQTMSLEFRPNQSITIPSFQFTIDGKTKYSKEQYLKVVDSKDKLSKKERSFLIEMKLNKSKIYQDESAILTVYFRHKRDIGLMKMEYEKPQFLDFFAKHIGKEKIYQDGNFTVYQLSYMLTPKYSGLLSIAPANIKVAILNRKLQKEGWYRDILSWHRVVANDLKISVKKLNSSYDMVGEFKIEETINRSVTKANKPVKLTIEVYGEGSLELYKGLKFDIPNVTIYSGDANITSILDSKKLKSLYRKSFVFIASDDFVIPSQTIRVFEPKSGRVEILKTKSYTITVGNSLIKVEEKRRGFLLDGYWAILIAFVFGVLSTLFIEYIFGLYKRYKSNRVGFNGHGALQILYPHSKESVEIEEMVRKLYAIKNGEKGIEIDKKKLNKMLEEYSSKGA